MKLVIPFFMMNNFQSLNHMVRSKAAYSAHMFEVNVGLYCVKFIAIRLMMAEIHFKVKYMHISDV